MSESTRFEEDFEFTFDILEGFFKQGRVQQALTAIEKAEITGWEKWWQIELALFLSQHNDISDWNMEEPFFTDRRTAIKQDSIAVDLCFRRKRHSTDSMIFLELKQDANWQRCIDNMMRDADKIYRSQSRSLGGAAIRNFFVVGVYPRESKADVHDYVTERAGKVAWMPILLAVSLFRILAIASRCSRGPRLQQQKCRPHSATTAQAAPVSFCRSLLSLSIRSGTCL